MNIRFIYIHAMLHNQIMNELIENLLVVLLHAPSIAEVAVQEANLLRIGSICNK